MAKYEQFEDLPVWKDGMELAEQVYALTDRVKGKRSFCDQLERASLSVSNNIAEGFERGTTSELLSFLYIARGSAGEARSMTYLLEKLEPDLKSQISDLRNKCESISRQLYAWMESLKNSGIGGQRKLDDKQRRNYRIEKQRESALDELRRLTGNPKLKI